MKIQAPPEMTRALVEDLSAIVRTGTGRGLNVLRAYPVLADRPEVQEALFDVLGSRDLGFRELAAMLLADRGNPAGLEHLVYNALSVHPVYGYPNWQSSSGWGDELVSRRAEQLTEGLLEALAQDMQPLPKHSHANPLALASHESILDLIKPALADSGRRPFAAYVLAFKGAEDAASLLQHYVGRNEHLEMMLTGLARLGTPESLNALERVENGTHDSYYRTRARLLREGALARTEKRFCDWFLSSFRLNVQQLVADRKQARPDIAARLEKAWISIPPDASLELLVVEASGIKAADVLVLFSTPSERRRLAEVQGQAVRDLFMIPGVTATGLGSLKYSGISPTFIPPVCMHPTAAEASKSFYLRGFSIEYEEEDYIRAATNWIEDPMAYFQGPKEGVLPSIRKVQAPAGVLR